MKTKKNIKSIAALFLCVILMLTAGCAKGTEKEQTAGTTSGKALAEMNDIPADGIITKEQFQSVAGKEQKVQFKGTTEDGITYVWTYDCAKIQNPEDQNLKIDFYTGKFRGDQETGKRCKRCPADDDARQRSDLCADTGSDSAAELNPMPLILSKNRTASWQNE